MARPCQFLQPCQLSGIPVLCRPLQTPEGMARGRTVFGGLIQKKGSLGDSERQETTGSWPTLGLSCPLRVDFPWAPGQRSGITEHSPGGVGGSEWQPEQMEPNLVTVGAIFLSTASVCCQPPVTLPEAIVIILSLGFLLPCHLLYILSRELFLFIQ